jgi:hypothetical protein
VGSMLWQQCVVGWDSDGCRMQFLSIPVPMGYVPMQLSCLLLSGRARLFWPVRAHTAAGILGAKPPT